MAQDCSCCWTFLQAAPWETFLHLFCACFGGTKLLKESRAAVPPDRVSKQGNGTDPKCYIYVSYQRFRQDRVRQARERNRPHALSTDFRTFHKFAGFTVHFHHSAFFVHSIRNELIFFLLPLHSSAILPPPGMAQTAVLAPAQGLCNVSTIVRSDVRGRSAFLGSNAAFVARSVPKHARRGRFVTMAVAEDTVAAGIKVEDVQGAINTVSSSHSGIASC